MTSSAYRAPVVLLAPAPPGKASKAPDEEPRGWLIDLVDIEEMAPHQYCVRDLFIDIAVEPSGSYRVIDIDDFVQAIELEILDKEQVVKVLRSLDLIVDKLNKGRFPLDILQPLVKKYAPTLQA